MRRIFITAFIIFFIFSLLTFSFAENENVSPPMFAGEFFGIKITLENYIFIRNTIVVFGNKWGPPPRTPEILDKIIWDQLLMSFEAFRRGITVSQEEIDEEISKTLAARKVKFDWKKDRDSYREWIKENTNEPAEIFEGQLKHLIQIHKLRQQIMDSVEPSVSKKEAYQEFLNENNNLGVELVQFENKKDATKFYKKARSYKNFWEEEKKKRPKDFKRPGNVSLEFLIDLWGFPKNACYKMVKMKPGQIYKPAPIYRGYGVFKILANRRADKSAYPKAKEGYFKQIKNRKKFEALKNWFEDLKKQANISKYDAVIDRLSKSETSEQKVTEE